MAAGTVPGDERRPRRTQMCVYGVKGVNDCLQRIAGLNSPASNLFFFFKTDTSYNNHALKTRAHTHIHSHTHTGGGDATPTPNCSYCNKRRRVATQSAHKAPTGTARSAILAQFHFRSGFPPHHHDVLQLLDESKSGGCIFFFVLAQMRAADPDRNSNKCTAERTRGDVQKYLRCPGCRYCPANTAII